MAIKSLISQSRQIKASKTFDDTLSMGGDNSARSIFAEGTSYLEEDLNVIRTIIREITGTSNWSDSPITSLNTLDALNDILVLQPVQTSITSVNGANKATGLNQAVDGTIGTEDLGYVVEDSNATLALGSDATVAIRDAGTNMPLLNDNELEIFGILRRNSGDNGITVYFFVDNAGSLTPANIVGDIEVIVPERVNLKNISETALMTNAGFASAVGSIETGSRVYTDANDNSASPIFNFVENEDITSAINRISPIVGNNVRRTDTISSNTGITSDNFTTTFGTDGANYLADSDTFIAAIVKLDTQLKTTTDAASSVSVIKQVEILDADINEDVIHVLPNSATYESSNNNAMDVFVNGQLMVSDSKAGGANLGDYAENSGTQVTFHFPLEIGDVIVYVIKVEA